MDSVNQKFGNMVVTYGGLLPGKENAWSRVIPLSWSPNGIKSVKYTEKCWYIGDIHNNLNSKKLILKGQSLWMVS
jgi:hypothetical protein